MTGQAATQTPSGFHIMMPPGWARYLVDDEGKRALLRQTSARMWELSRPDLDRLRQELLRLHAAQPDLDRAALEGQLKEHGFSDVLERVLSREVYEAAPFAHPAKSLADRREQWLAAWDQPRRREICTEIREDGRVLGTDLTAERWAPVSAKKAQYETLTAGDLTDDEGLAGLQDAH